MKTLSRFVFALVTLSVLYSVGNAQHAQGHRGNVVEGNADPRIPTHEPRLHHPFDDRLNEFIGHERVLSGVFTPHAQFWVVDTALVYSTTDTTRHTYSFNGQAKMTIDLLERWTNNQWEDSSRHTWTYDANGRELTELDERWTNSQWVNSDRFTITYDANGRLLTGLDEQWTNNQWVNSERFTVRFTPVLRQFREQLSWVV